MCSSNCPTRDHENFGACVRAKGISAQWLGGDQPSYGTEKRFNRVNDDYIKAVKYGLMPKAISRRGIDEAYRAAEKG